MYNLDVDDDGFELNKPLTEELYARIDEHYMTNAWEASRDRMRIVPRLDESSAPHLDLEQLITEVLEPNGYQLNGKVSIEEDPAYTGRVFTWEVSVKDNILTITNEQEKEELQWMKRLEESGSDHFMDTLAQFFKQKGYEKLSAYIQNKKE